MQKVQIERFLAHRPQDGREGQIAFYGGNFLGLGTGAVLSLLEAAAGYIEKGAANSIRFSTRPDTIDPDRLDLLAPFPVSTVELGAQSMSDRVLRNCRRGHTARSTEKAVWQLKARGYRIGLQMMVGLPGDDGPESLASAKKIASLSPDFVRIYPTLVLAGSPLAKAYEAGRYAPLSLDTCVDLVTDLYLVFHRSGIRVVRMGLQASEDLDDRAVVLAGPHHPAFGHLVYSRLFFRWAKAGLEEKQPVADGVIIRVHPRNLSRMRGQKNGNIHELKKAFGIESLVVKCDEAVPRDGVMLEATAQRKEKEGFQS